MRFRTSLLIGLIAGCCVLPAQAQILRFTVGPEFIPGPMSVKPDKEISPGNYTLIDAAGKRKVPAQVETDGVLWWWESQRKAGEQVEYELSSIVDSEIIEGKKDVKLDPKPDQVINVSIENKLFAAFNYKRSEPKPYLYPIIGPTGDPVTRDFPMKDNPSEREGKAQDHPHHRSLWCSHGDIRRAGVDKSQNYWSECKDCDKQRVSRIIRLSTGPVFARIEAEIEWLDGENGQRDLTEQRSYTFFVGDSTCRIIDIRNVLKFTDGDITFGDTKEGGIVSIRVPMSMQEKPPGKGQMLNSRGQKGMNECWGKPAEWCDYVGPVNGNILGIAVFDHPANYGHPVHWHIRDYGLYATNPFGLRAFDKSNADGSKTWKKGESIEFNNRIFIHKGDTRQARVNDMYKLYASQTKVLIANQ